MSPSASVPSPSVATAHTLGRWFTAARREGLLALLAPEVWHTLSALLSFTGRDGRREFTVDQLAISLGQSREVAQARLDQLAATQWRDEPLAVLEHDLAGEIIGATLAPLDVLSGAKAPRPVETPLPLPELAPVPTEALAKDLGPSLAAVGLNSDQIAGLLRRFPPERIRRQLDWLPQRQARNPAALLIRAIEDDWSAPREAAWNPLDTAPDFHRGYLRVPLSLWAELYCRAPLTRRQLQLISVVLRESWGWQRRGQVQLWTRPLTSRQLARLTSLSTDHLRRDLQSLVQRGILREQDQQYQLVSDPQLWKTRGTRAPKQRAPAPKPPALPAKTALSAPGSKIVNKKQRYGAGPVDKSAAPPVIPESQNRLTEPSVLEARFCQVVEAFVGTLSAAERQALRQWIAQDGVPVVWQALAEPFRQGPPAVRQYLEHRLGQAGMSPA